MFKTVVDYFDGNCHFGVYCYFNVNYGRPYVYACCFVPNFPDITLASMKHLDS